MKHAVRRGKQKTVPQQLKTTIENKPQNSDVYVNSEVHYFKTQRGINIEAVISFVYVHLRLQRTVSLASEGDRMYAYAR